MDRSPADSQPQSPHLDVGATHVALPVLDVDRSVDFYSRYAAMKVVHRRADAATGNVVAWISDLTRPFVIVLIQAPIVSDGLKGFWCHLGIGVKSRDEVDRLCAQAAAEGRMVVGPTDSGYPVGYWAYIADPDGNNLEISYGQEVGFTVEASRA